MRIFPRGDSREGVQVALQRPEVERALSFAVGHINVSSRHPVSAEELLCSLLCVDPYHADTAHVAAFFEDTDLATICDLVITGVISYKQLAEAAALHLPEDHETMRWLDERRDF